MISFAIGVLIMGVLVGPRLVPLLRLLYRIRQMRTETQRLRNEAAHYAEIGGRTKLIGANLARLLELYEEAEEMRDQLGPHKKCRVARPPFQRTSSLLQALLPRPIFERRFQAMLGDFEGEILEELAAGNLGRVRYLRMLGHAIILWSVICAIAGLLLGLTGLTQLVAAFQRRSSD